VRLEGSLPVLLAIGRVSSPIVSGAALAFSELRPNVVLRSWREAFEGSIMPLVQGKRTRRPMNTKEAPLVTEDTPPTDNGVPEDTPARQDVDVLLNVEELEVDRIKLVVRDLRAHVSLLAELANLVNVQVGVDARLGEVDLEIDGVRAKVLLKVKLEEIRRILNHALDTLAEHPEILRILARAIEELVSGTLEGVVGELEDVLGGLDVGGTVDEALKGRLEDVRDTLQGLLEQVGDRAQQAAGGLVGGTGVAWAEGGSSSGDEPSGATTRED
jgi:hypothetical protein